MLGSTKNERLTAGYVASHLINLAAQGILCHMSPVGTASVLVQLLRWYSLPVGLAYVTITVLVIVVCTLRGKVFLVVKIVTGPVRKVAGSMASVEQDNAALAALM